MSITATLFAQILAFVLVVWLVKRLLWAPLTQAMEKRQTEIADGLAAAEEGERSLAQAEEQKQQTHKEAQAKAAEIVAQAERQAGEIIAQAKETARQEGEREKQAAQGEVEQMLNRARESLRREVGALAAAGAARVLAREVDANSHADALRELESKL